MYIFETLILATLAPALVSSSVALPAAEKRALCNADNCLNALKNHAASASAYCTSYTTSVQTATTGFPTYIPQTCGPSRVSSACSCLATTTTTTTTSTTTTTPTACSTPTGYYGDNYVSNPDFYGIMQDQTLAPWVITNEEGSPGCNYVRGYVWGCQTCGSAEDPDAIGCNFPAAGGTDSVSQTVSLCAGQNYTLLVHAACWRNGPGGDSTTPKGSPAYGTQFSVTFNNIVIIPKQLTCFPCDPNDYQCNNLGNSDAEYFSVTGTIVGPASGSGVLKLEAEARSSSHTFIGLLLDAVFIRPQ